MALARYYGAASYLFLLSGLGLIALSFWRRHAWMFALIFLGGVMIGLWRGGLEMEGLAVYANAIGKTTTITGRVSADLQAATRGGQAITVTDIVAAGQHINGTLYVTTKDQPKLRRDDTVTIHGKLTPSQGTYAASIYDASITQLERPTNIALDVRDTFSDATSKALPGLEASLGLGILVGQKSALPSDFTEALKVAGLTHIVVASGYNLTVLVRFARRIFGKISKYQAALWSVIMILGFMAITGWSASMTRAGLVAGLSLWAWYYGRQFHPVTLLALVGAVTVMVYPPYAWNDVGWALSFAAFVGVVIMAPLLKAYFYGTEHKQGFIAQTLLETAAAQLLTLPIMLGVFGQLSIVALISNVMIVPLVSFAMLATFIAGVAQIFLPVLASILAWPAQILLGYIVWAVNWTASFPWAQVKWQLPAWGVVVSYMIILAIILYLRRVTGYQLRQVNIVE